jgi:hypothetical protein
VGSRWRQLRRADHHFAQAEVMINAVISNRSALTASASSGPPDPARRVSAPRAHRRHGRQPHQRPGHQDLVTSRLSRVGLGAERARVRPGSHQCVGSAGYLLVVLAYRFRLARLARPERSLKSAAAPRPTRCSPSCRLRACPRSAMDSFLDHTGDCAGGSAAARDLGDHFTFRFDARRTLVQGIEGVRGAAEARLGPRLFERFGAE